MSESWIIDDFAAALDQFARMGVWPGLILFDHLT